MIHLSADKTIVKAKSKVKNGQIVEAKKLCKMLLNSYPKNLNIQQFPHNLEKNLSLNEIYRELADLYNRAEYKKVIKHSKKYLKYYSKNIYLWNFVGVGNLALGNDHIALNSFKKAISLKPDFWDALNNLGVTLEKLKKLDDAIKIYYKIILINPNFSKAYNNLGNVLRKKGDFNRAIEFFYKSISLEPNYPDAHSNLAIILSERGRTSEAIASYKKVLLFKPKCAATLNSLGNAYKDQDKFDEAINVYRKALSIESDFEMARAQKLFMLSCICDWKSIEQNRSFIKNLGINKKFVPPFSLFSLEDIPQNHKKRS